MERIATSSSRSASATSWSASAGRSCSIISSLDVRRGEILGLVGASGGGKSVLMRTIIGLIPRQGGDDRGAGRPIGAASRDRRARVERRWGILFQQGALFSSLTVRQNVQFPMRENLVAVASADGRDRHRQARDGRAAGRGRRQVSVRAVRRHDQARGAGARARARSARSCSSTSRPRGSTRSRPAISTR